MKNAPSAWQQNLVASLADWLCRRPDIFQVAQRTFSPGHVVEDAVVPSNRLILISQGSLQYQVEDQAFTFKKGSELFIPAWARRGWTASRSHPCKLVWVEFGPSSMDEIGPIHRQNADGPLEKTTFARLLKLWRNRDATPFHGLLMESELKFLQAQFFSKCGETSPCILPLAPESSAERAVSLMVQALKTHFDDQEALTRILSTSDLSANYLRRLFRQKTGMTVSVFLTQLRLRQARYYLRETELPVKEVSRRVGLNDPLRFSKLYRQFWGHAPMAERL